MLRSAPVVVLHSMGFDQCTAAAVDALAFGLRCSRSLWSNLIVAEVGSLEILDSQIEGDIFQTEAGPDIETHHSLVTRYNYFSAVLSFEVLCSNPHVAVRTADLDIAVSRRICPVRQTSSLGCPCHYSTAPVELAGMEEHTVGADGRYKVAMVRHEVLGCCTPCCDRPILQSHHRLKWLYKLKTLPALVVVPCPTKSIINRYSRPLDIGSSL